MAARTTIFLVFPVAGVDEARIRLRAWGGEVPGVIGIVDSEKFSTPRN